MATIVVVRRQRVKGSECFFLHPGLQVPQFKGIDAKVFESSRYPVYVWRVSLWFSQVPSLESSCSQGPALCPVVSHFG